MEGRQEGRGSALSQQLKSAGNKKESEKEKGTVEAGTRQACRYMQKERQEERQEKKKRKDKPRQEFAVATLRRQSMGRERRWVGKRVSVSARLCEGKAMPAET